MHVLLYKAPTWNFLHSPTVYLFIDDLLLVSLYAHCLTIALLFSSFVFSEWVPISNYFTHFHKSMMKTPEGLSKHISFKRSLTPGSIMSEEEVSSRKGGKTAYFLQVG